MNYEEILDKLKENHTIIDVAYGTFNSVGLGLGDCTLDVWKKGGLDEGSDWRRVHHFVDHDVYIEVYGFYSSYDGVDFSDDWNEHVKQVVPKEVMITVYE